MKRTLVLVAALLMTAQATAQDNDSAVAKALGLRCLLEDGVAGTVIKNVWTWEAAKFSSNVPDALVTFDLMQEKMTGNGGLADIRVLRAATDLHIVQVTPTGNFTVYTIFGDVPARMPEQAGGIIRNGYRMVHSRHMNFTFAMKEASITASQYSGVCVVTD